LWTCSKCRGNGWAFWIGLTPKGRAWMKLCSRWPPVYRVDPGTGKMEMWRTFGATAARESPRSGGFYFQKTERPRLTPTSGRCRRRTWSPGCGSFADELLLARCYLRKDRKRHCHCNLTSSFDSKVEDNSWPALPQQVI
jgi:hypothetical protein